MAGCIVWRMKAQLPASAEVYSPIRSHRIEPGRKGTGAGRSARAADRELVCSSVTVICELPGLDVALALS
jgi:hypothetical protein